MANPEIEKASSVERNGKGPELKASRAEIRRVSRAEKEAAEKDLALRGEKAERVIAAEREKAKETEAVMKKETGSAERKKDKEPTSSPRLRPKPKTKEERDTVYKAEMKQVQAQLSPAERTFSKVIHNNVVEKVSDAAERTIMRPSALIGGAVLGLILGAIVYFIAITNNYFIGSLEMVVLFIIGAVVGVVVELAIRRVLKR
jgi:F0F1-type ATP synthase assembly protein I